MEPINIELEGVEISIELNQFGDIEIITTDHRQPRDHKYVMNVQYNNDNVPQVRILSSTGIVRVLRAIEAYILPSHKEA